MSDLSDVLVCTEKFESLVAEFYRELSEKVGDKLLSTVFRWVSMESSGHAELVSGIRESLNIPRVEINCSAVVGEPWVALTKSTKKLVKIDKADSRVIGEILADVKVLENFAGEETYGKLLYPLIKNLIAEAGEELKDSRMKLDILTILLNKIVLDEKYHEKLIDLISGLLRK